jgi:DNA-binding response OmpR family regulator
MSQALDTILIVDDDLGTRTFLREQVFLSQNYRVLEAKDAPDALLLLRQDRPDLIVLDLQLAGLSGHDLLVAVQSQGYRGPLIAMAEAISPRAVIEAFRLGATDYIARPLREAEVLAAVERGLAEVRLRRQRDSLVTQLQISNRQLEARIKQLTALYDIGQSVTVLTDMDSLYQRALDGALDLSGADHAMLFLRDDKSGKLILKAGKNLPLTLLDRMGEPIQDRIAELAVSSREPVILAGDSLRQFNAPRDLCALAYIPLAVQKTVVGVLAVSSSRSQGAFSEEHGRLLRALGAYIAIAMVGARLSMMLEQRSGQMQAAVRELQERDKHRTRQTKETLTRLHQPLIAIEAEIIRLGQSAAEPVPNPVRYKLAGLGQQVRQLITYITNLQQKPG